MENITISNLEKSTTLNLKLCVQKSDINANNVKRRKYLKGFKVRIFNKKFELKCLLLILTNKKIKFNRDR